MKNVEIKTYVSIKDKKIFDNYTLIKLNELDFIKVLYFDISKSLF